MPLMFWRNRWVSAEATGGGDGSQERPFTLAEAIASARPGDRVVVPTRALDPARQRALPPWPAQAGASD